jgi:hypothetical protein
MLQSTTSKKVATTAEITFNESKKKQQAQMDIFYNKGRKIYNVTRDTVHLKEFRSSFSDDSEKPDWNYSTLYRSNRDRGGQPWRIDLTQRVDVNKQIMSCNDSNIIPGYKGIMALDLTNIPYKFQSQAVEQHYKDIREYKREQAARPARDRYENTVERAEKIHRLDAIAADKRRKEALDAQQLRYEHRAKGRRKFIEQKTFINDTV